MVRILRALGVRTVTHGGGGDAVKECRERDRRNAPVERVPHTPLSMQASDIMRHLSPAGIA